MGVIKSQGMFASVLAANSNIYSLSHLFMQ